MTYLIPYKGNIFLKEMYWIKMQLIVILIIIHPGKKKLKS